MNGITQQERAPKSVQTRQIKVGKWNDILQNSDVNQIWMELHRIVSSHPLVRASKRAGFLVEEGKYNAYTDLTQELFVALLSKGDFNILIRECRIGSDAEISSRIIYVTAELANEPESYRLVRRVSTLIHRQSL